MLNKIERISYHVGDLYIKNREYFHGALAAICFGAAASGIIKGDMVGIAVGSLGILANLLPLKTVVSSYEKENNVFAKDLKKDDEERSLKKNNADERAYYVEESDLKSFELN